MAPSCSITTEEILRSDVTDKMRLLDVTIQQANKLTHNLTRVCVCGDSTRKLSQTSRLDTEHAIHAWTQNVYAVRDILRVTSL
jgi:hypothetical protein